MSAYEKVPTSAASVPEYMSVLSQELKKTSPKFGPEVVVAEVLARAGHTYCEQARVGHTPDEGQDCRNS